MGTFANDNGHRSLYAKRTFEDGMTLWGAPALNHEIKLAGGPLAWAHKVNSEARNAALTEGVIAAIMAYDHIMREAGLLLDRPFEREAGRSLVA